MNRREALQQIGVGLTFFSLPACITQVPTALKDNLNNNKVEEKSGPISFSGEMKELEFLMPEYRKNRIQQAKEYLEALKIENPERYALVAEEVSSYFQNQPEKMKRKVFVLNPENRPYIPEYTDFQSIVTKNPVCQDLTWSCYDYSGALMYEQVAKSKGYEINIDRSYMDYVVYRNQLQRIVSELVENGAMNSVFVDDGSCASFYRAIDQGGILPTGLRESNVTKQGGFSRDMTVYLSQQTAKLKTDTTLSAEEKIEKIQKFMQELADYYGNPPSEFERNGKKYTPHSLQQTIGVGKADFVSIVNIPDKKYSSVVDNNRFIREDHQTHDAINFNVASQTLRALMRHSLQQGVPFEVGLDTGEPGVRVVWDASDTEAKSLIVGNWPQGADFNYETEALKTEYKAQLDVLSTKKYGEMTSDEQEKLRRLRRTIGDITPNHVITVVGSVRKYGKMFYLAHDSGLGVAGNGNLRILDEEYIIANNVGLNFKRETAKIMIQNGLDKAKF